MKPILISGAMDIEVDTLISKLNAEFLKEINGYSFFKAEVNGYPIILQKTKVGMINASISTTLAILEFSPCLVINQGCFGGYSNLHTREMLIATKTKNITFFRTAKGDEQNLVDWQYVGADLQNEEGGLDTSKALQDIFLSIPCSFANVHKGIIGSGDVWNREKHFIKFLNESLGVLGEDMESHAVNTVCKKFDIPFISTRIVSNNELLNEDYDEQTVILCQEYIISALDKLILFAKDL